MHRVFQRLVIAFLAFVFGISAAWFSGILIKVEMLLAKVSPGFVFAMSSRGCGCGWTQDYVLLDGHTMYESSSGICYKTPEEARGKLQSIITKASEIVNQIPSSKNRFGNYGEKIELLYVDESGEKRAKVLWYDGNTHFFEIDAPTLEIANVFEEVKAE